MRALDSICVHLEEGIMIQYGIDKHNQMLIEIRIQ
jgi:hypothetical protein